MVAPGSTFGNYVIVRPLSSGGMSDAFLARSPAGRLVVLKKPRNYDPELAARSRDEGRLGARIYHQYLVETLDAFEHEGMPVLVLGYVEGPTLDDMRKQAPLPPASVARIGCQIAEALGAIIGAIGDDGTPLGALHRDVTARNIVVTHAGDAVLIDLGIAKFNEARDAKTETGMVLGTLRYMAPEIVDGQDATALSDFYSLGCVLIEACTGQPVFIGPPSLVTANIVTQGPLPPASAALVAPALRAVLERMIARQPADRLQQAHEISRALRAVEEQLGGGQEALGDRARTFVATTADVPAQTGQGAQVGLANMAVTNVDDSPPAPAGPSVTQSFFNGGGARPLEASRPQAPVRVAVLPAPLAGGSLELDLAPRPRSRETVVPRERSDFYPKQKRDWSWLSDGAKNVIIVVVLLVGGLLAWRWYDEGRRAEDRRLVEEKLGQETELLQKALAETPTDCSSNGGYWLYKDKRGSPVVVDSMGKIPKQHRAEAQCVKSAR